MIKISPIRYMGNKRKLINRGLIELFPKKIGVFYDMFGGSGVVGLNTNANNHFLNDIDINVYELYVLFKTIPPQEIIEHTTKQIEKYELPQINTDKRKVGEEVRDYYKEKYLMFRAYYNSNPNPKDLYVLMNYAMSQTMRFNKSGGFNMPFGNNRFILEKHGEEIKQFHEFLQTATISNSSYLDINIDGREPFVYLDPPYLHSTATYNENGKWGLKEQETLLSYCDKLHSQNIKFGLSNTFENKGARNDKLMEWVENNNYKVHYFDNFDYCTFGTGKSNTVEVYIYNY